MTGLEKATSFLLAKGYENRILTFSVSTATVSLAAAAIGCQEAHIAKSVTFYGQNDDAILILMSGDAKVDSSLFKKQFGFKARMLKGDDVEKYTGYQVGGVSPFDLPKTTSIYFDESLYRFTTIYPACGNASSVARFELKELEILLDMPKRINVCKDWQ